VIGCKRIFSVFASKVGSWLTTLCQISCENCQITFINARLQIINVFYHLTWKDSWNPEKSQSVWGKAVEFVRSLNPQMALHEKPIMLFRQIQPHVLRSTPEIRFPLTVCRCIRKCKLNLCYTRRKVNICSIQRCCRVCVKVALTWRRQRHTLSPI